MSVAESGGGGDQGLSPFMHLQDRKKGSYTGKRATWDPQPEVLLGSFLKVLPLIAQHSKAPVRCGLRLLSQLGLICIYCTASKNVKYSVSRSE
ncbi:GD24591 [Drosophila simulans]|uniref:GD24591 n=1 Tax=Drosophila simulans TaxID=7240 RepID=B4NU23_DROSI|nr:GD24591 [Drosophila simulans]